MGIDTLFEKLLGLDPGTAAGITLVLFAGAVFIAVWKGSGYIKSRNQQAAQVAMAQVTQQTAQDEINLQLIKLAQTQVDNNEAMIKQMEKIELSYREMGKLISGLTSALSKFTSTVMDKIESHDSQIKELETSIITLVEQNQRNHDAVISGQSFTSDSMTSLRAEISALTGQISVLVNTINMRESANGDVGAKVDNLATEVKRLTQAVEAREQHSKSNEKADQPLEAKS